MVPAREVDKVGARHLARLAALDHIVEEVLDVANSLGQLGGVGDVVDRLVECGDRGVQEARRVGFQRDGEDLLAVAVPVVGAARARLSVLLLP